MRGARILVGLCGLLAAWLAQAQAPATERFEVASVKPAGPPGVGQGTEARGGPGTSDPGQITYTRMFLTQVFRLAFEMSWEFELSGPGWLDSERFTISAKIPAGATQEQFRHMLQNLLVDRFGLKFHHESKIVPAYELVVTSSGVKFRESDVLTNASPAAPPPRTVATDKDGFPVLPPGVNSARSVQNGRVRLSARMMSISALAGRLERETGRPVIDKTGLTGAYDLKLDYSVDGLGGQLWVARAQQGLDAGAPDDGGPTLFNALQQQLGLKLEDRKEPFDVIVIDHLEKVPTED
jgi:uncharacterized protein (TIGR03435 family)